MKRNPYEILGLSPDAPVEEVKVMYTLLAVETFSKDDAKRILEIFQNG